MAKRHKKFKQAAFLLHVRPTVLYTTKIIQLLYSAPTCAHVRALDAPLDHTKLPFGTKQNSGWNANTAKQKEQRQVNKKFCELKGGNIIEIVEKAQETRFGMSLKYSRYIGIAS